MLLVSPTGEHLKYNIQMLLSDDQATNNTTEYEGLLAGLLARASLSIRWLVIRGDS